MTPDISIRPIRRSPLESVHAALGARWLEESARWPTSYGDPEAEAADTASAAGIADLGPFDKLVVRGPRSRAALEAAGISTVVGMVTSGEGAQAWCLADDEVVLLMPPPIDDLRGRLRGAGAAVTDLGSGLSVLRLVGPASVAILERACPVDLSPRAVPDEGIVQAPVAGVRMMVARQDHLDAPGYTLLVARDLAEYSWGALFDLGRDFGLMPVGGTVTSATRP
jgi:heterotetrameric sarcosine oxidase gamma subunit